MRSVLLESRDTIIERNNGRSDLREIWKEEKMEFIMNESINRYIYLIYVEIMRKY